MTIAWATPMLLVFAFGFAASSVGVSSGPVVASDSPRGGDSEIRIGNETNDDKERAYRDRLPKIGPIHPAGASVNMPPLDHGGFANIRVRY